MPSRRHRTPYPPAAQLFFRLIVAIGNSTLAMKLALVACDLLTIAVLWRWLAASGRSEWLTLAYAWNPLTVLEIAHSGHIDALGALWITATAYWLTHRRTALACVAFVLAVATKLLPIVLAPLLLGRVRPRDLILGIALAALLYLPFTFGTELPLGALPNVVANIRFNGPVFRALAWVSSPQIAAAVALVTGMSAALWARARLPASDPAAWAWPMAIALLGAPVIYPWYLLYLTPFLFTRATMPLLVWTISVIPVYLVWHLARAGGRWAAPPAVMMVEYGALLIACVMVLRRPQSPDA
jgi:alpha-1,6-mannosyltransferase